MLKKRIFALILCICIFTCSLSSVAFASTTTKYVGGNNITMITSFQTGNFSGGSYTNSNTLANRTKKLKESGLNGDGAYCYYESGDTLYTSRMLSIAIARSDGTALFKKGEKVKLDLTGFSIYWGSAPVFGTRLAYLVQCTELYCYVSYTDGTSSLFQLSSDDLVFKIMSNVPESLSLINSFVTSKDIKSLNYGIIFDKNCFSQAYSSSNCKALGVYFNNLKLNYEITTDDTAEIRGGVLGIVDTLQNVFTSLISGFSDVISNGGNIFTSVKNGFSDLASKSNSILTQIMNLPNSI